MKYFLPILIFLSLAYSQDSTTVAIITTDGTEIIGEIIEESDIEYQIETPAGLTVKVPKKSIYKMTQFKGIVKEGKLFRPDPNKSLYIFAPSAYPIGQGGKYCRDFCVFFPSINYGLTDILSAQAGIFWAPMVDIDKIPIIGSLKASLFQQDKIALAAGGMYIRFPTIDVDDNDGKQDDIRVGGGFLFGTATYGDHLNHASLSLGWGFAQGEGEWETMDRPIVVIAGNKRISQTLALVTENWFWPELDLKYVPLSLSVRFLGKRIATDIGLILNYELISEVQLPFPIINFTYHF